MKQNNFSLFEFISEIKNRCAKFKNLKSTRRQSVTLQILLKALNDHTLSEAVALQNPKSLDITVALIKFVKIKEAVFLKL